MGWGKNVKVKGTVLFCLLTLLPLNAFAEVPVNYNQIRQMVKELKTLHASGVKIHKQYNLSSTQDVRSCVDKNGHLRKKAKSLIDESDKIGSFFYRTKLNPAAYAAFSCVYCGGDGSSCDQIPPAVKAVEAMLVEAGN